MKNQKYFSILLALLLVVFIVPQIAFAAWWNPFSWHIWNIFFSKLQTSIVQPNQNTNQNQVQNTTPKSNPIPTPTQNTPANKTNLKIVNDGDFGVSIKIPTDWVQVKTPNPSVWLSFMAYPNSSMGSQDFELTTGTRYNGWLQGNISAQQNVISSEATTIDGKTAQKIVRGNKNPSLETITVLIDGGSKYYKIDWTMSVSSLNKNQNTINQVLSSIHFTK